MTFLRIFSTTSALALIASPALALTADQVWNDWKDMLDSYGAEISTASEDQSGGTLTVSGLTASFSVQDGSMAMNLGDIAFAEQGDGSVVITMAETMPFTMDVKGPDGKEGRVGFTLSQPGAKLVASGDPDNMRYDFDYPSFGMSDFTIEGDDVPQDLPVTFDMTGAGIAGFITIAGGDTRSFVTESTIASLSANMDIDDPTQGKGGFRMSLTDLTQSAHGTFADIEMNMSAAELIQSGLSQVGSGTYGPSTYEFSFDGPDGAFQIAMAAENGTLDFSFDENGINYGGVTKGLTATVSSNAMPLPPMTFRMAETEGRLRMPLVPSEDAQDFGLVVTMIGLEIDDMLWGMIDPAGMLMHDPATLVIDLGGTAVINQDFTNPDYAESMPSSPPGTVESLDINAIQLKIAGAELTGDGDFTFNNAMGMPMPSGTMNLMLTGGNALLDTLVNMGMVPEDQAMGARMMLGMFARPGEGADTLVSTIQVNEDGSVLANGQRIK